MKLRYCIWTFVVGLLTLAPASAQESFIRPSIKTAWIGYISDADAHIPSNRNYTGTGTLNEKGKPDWKATDPRSSQSVWLKKEVKLGKNIKQATLYVACGGMCQMQINGQTVSDDLFSPLWSDYDKTIFYNTYNVTSLLKKGKNELLATLGNGFYNEHGRRYAKMKISYGVPSLRCLLEVEYQNGKRQLVATDETWQVAPSNITFNSIYGGEDYDARITTEKHPLFEGGDYVKTSWREAVIVDGPKGTLRPQEAMPIKMMETFGIKSRHNLTAEEIKKASTKKHPIPEGTFVLDMGQNLSGFPQITVSGKAGQTVRLYPSETLTPEGACNQKQTGSPYYLSYTLKGGSDKLRVAPSSSDNSNNSETWHPLFTYYGYRYIQVEGAVMEGDDNPKGLPVIKDVRSCFVYNSAPKTGSFACSNERFNNTYQIIDRAIRSNWQGVWSDCPHREKLGWLEQDWLNGEGLVYNYDCRAMIRQTMRNIVDAQHADGAVPTTAPEYIFFKGKWLDPFAESPEWGGAIVALPMLYLDYYNDPSLVKEYYPEMKRYVDYLHTKDSCYILKQGLGDWYDYGTGRSGFSQNTPMPLVATAHYLLWTKMLAQAALISGHPEDYDLYAAQAANILVAFKKEFYDKEKHTYGTGSQCANAIALSLICSSQDEKERVLTSLIDDIREHGMRLTTGDIGNRYLFSILINSGLADLWYEMLNHDDVPGYGFQIKKGMTTLTEQWNPEMGASMNHFMMAHINNHLIQDIAGIHISRGNITINPRPVGDMEWAKGSCKIYRERSEMCCEDGELVSSSWKKENGKFILDVEIPEGASATILLPYSHKEIKNVKGKQRFEESLNSLTPDPSQRRGE